MAALIIAVVFGLPAYGILAPNGSNKHPTSPSVPTSPPNPPHHQRVAEPEFLDNTVPTGGTAPTQKGLVTANGQNLPDSLVYGVDFTNVAADSPQTVQYDLGGRFRTFTSTVGLDRCGLTGVSATFQVRADGKNVVNQNVPAGTNVGVSASIAGAHQLELVIAYNDNAGGCDLAVWGRAKVRP